MNGYPEVNEATRKRVRLVAEQHGYQPSTRAKALATGRAMAIGHVIPLSSRHEMVNPIFGDFISGAGETYSKNGFDMVLSIVSDGDEEKTYRDLKARGTVDGVILHGPRIDEPRIALLKDIGLPFVVHGRASGEAAPYAWLDVNNRRAFSRATNFLIDLGHNRIALINGLEEMDFAMRRRLGFLDAMAAKGLTPEPEFMKADEMTELYGYSAATKMLGHKHPPTAFVSASMISTLGVRRAIEERGLKMGRDVSIITHDDALSYLRNGGDIPIFTATRSSVRDAGRRAAEILLEQINNPNLPFHSELFEAELMVGQSTGPCLK